MSSLLRFLFDYRMLNWRQRLSSVELQYLQGRLVLAVLAVMLVMGSITGPAYALLPELIIRKVLIILGTGTMALAVLYFTFLSFKFSVMRMHDFNRSGWWLAAVVLASMLASIVIDYALPEFSSFVQLESLFFLGLLIWPGQMADNRFGIASAYPVRRSRFTMGVRVLALAGWAIGFVITPAVLLFYAFMAG